MPEAWTWSKPMMSSVEFIAPTGMPDGPRMSITSAFVRSAHQAAANALISGVFFVRSWAVAYSGSLRRSLRPMARTNASQRSVALAAM